MATNTAPPSPPLNEYELAAYLRLSVDTLRKDRQQGRRIPFYKIGRTVRYDLQRVREALASMECGGPPKPRRRAARETAAA
jgi:excisionase family DNA binding protein